MSTQQAAPPTYQIRLKEQLNKQWANWFDELIITVDGDGTLLTGPVADQAALFGILRKVRNAGLTLVSLNCDGS